MDSPKERELEARLASVEVSIAALQRTVDALMVERTEAPHAGWAYRSFRLGKREPVADPLTEGRVAGTPAAISPVGTLRMISGQTFRPGSLRGARNGG